jgi:1-acyl-sn-glycerol-3-phosphate acyltransferase
MGKLSLFRWPLRRFMFDMGGVPVDRSARGDYTAAMITEFTRRDEFALVVAPEGTRRSVKGWRSGFYHIALGAGVPIVPAWVDNQGLRGGLGPPIMPSGDYAADLALIAEFYLSKMPGHPKVLALAAQVAALKEVGND